MRWQKNAAGAGGGKEKRMGSFPAVNFTRFVNQLQGTVDTRRRHPEAERRTRQRAGAKPARGFLSSMLRSPGAPRAQRIQAVRLERAARRGQEGNTPARRSGRACREGTGARPVRRVGSRRTARVATPPGGDDSGGPGSEPPARPAQNARSPRGTFQGLGFSLFSQTLFDPLRQAGALATCAYMARWPR